jgi:ribonuclease BN (tRNA processing enzyme)
VIFVAAKKASDNMTTQQSSMVITPVPAFKDNYIWAIANSSGDVVVVDPGDAAPVEAYLIKTGQTLRAILITHHHADDTGGLIELCKAREIPVYGPPGNQIKGITQSVLDGDNLTLIGLEMTTYSDTIIWLAEQIWLRWQRDAIAWKGAIGGEINAIAFIYDRTVYDVNQDVWAEIIGIFGDPLATET